MGESPSTTLWRKVYREARRFWKLGPWEWMSDSMLFGIQDPTTGEVWYASILGRAGEVFGIAFYPGREGVDCYFSVWETDPEEADWDTIASQHCLRLTFEDPEEFTARDLEVIRKLGLKFQGQDLWPLFRSLRSGYQPWYITTEEARFLSLALPQVREVALWALDNPGEIEVNLEADDLVLVRIPEDEGGREWRQEWQPLPPPAPLPRAEALPPGLLESLTKAARPRYGIWEVDVFAVPAVVRESEDEPGCYMASRLCVHHESGYVLATEVQPFIYRFRGFAEWIAAVLGESSLGWPEEIWVRKPELVALLAPLCAELGIDLVYVAGLPALEEAQQSLISWLKEKSTG